jgi:hypothetical protein
MKLLLLSIVALVLVSCGSTKKIDRKGIKQLKKVAVIVYTVPEQIEFKDDPRGKKGGFSLGDIVKAIAKDATAGSGAHASDVSLKAFIKTANKFSLPFKLVSYKALKRNKKFIKLGSMRAPVVVEKKKSGFGGFMSKVGSMTGGDAPKASGPTYLKSFGLNKNWWDGKGLIGTQDEAAYIKASMEALGVDGVIIVNDPGFSFSCEACVASTGSASTGSAFNISIVGKNGKSLVDLRQWFSTSPGSAVIVTGIVNPLQQDKLFKYHGVKTAKLFVEELTDALKVKK